jgi:hypothetical protein
MNNENETVFDCLRQKYLNGEYMLPLYHIFMDEVLNMAGADGEEVMIIEQRERICMSARYRSCIDDMKRFLDREECTINFAGCLTSSQIEYLAKGKLFPVKN